MATRNTLCSRQAAVRAFALLPILLSSAACSGPPANVGPGEELGCYRGGLRVAEHSDGQLIVEGDLLVTETEQWCNSGSDLGPGLRAQGRRAPSEPGPVWPTDVYGSVWPNGVVPYTIDSA